MNKLATNSNYYFPEWKLVLATLIKNSQYYITPTWVIAQNLWEKEVFSNNKYDSKATIYKIRKYLNDLKRVNQLKNESTVEYIERDLSFLISLLKKREINKMNRISISKIKNNGFAILQKLMTLRAPTLGDIYLVKNFPKPYNSVKNWDMMFAGEKDKHKYGIEEGIYLHINRQFPLFWEFLILHEYVHHFIRSNITKPKAIGYKWIEEGMADWYALQAHYNIFKNWPFLVFFKNIYSIYEKVFPRSPLAEYAQYGKAIKRIYLFGGHNAVKKLLKCYLKHPDSKRWHILYRDMQSEKKEGYNQQTRAIFKTHFDKFLLTLHEKIDTINVSPLEYKILKVIQNRTTRGFNVRTSMSTIIKSENVNVALSNLKNQGFIIEYNKKYFLDDNTIHLLRSNVIKPTWI